LGVAWVLANRVLDGLAVRIRVLLGKEIGQERNIVSEIAETFTARARDADCHSPSPALPNNQTPASRLS